ncbi:MAG TPA: SAM-dependent methyltransferase [Ruminococcus sp.]|nr:SAM-dependent methyltransferase [Ruminococcus sp.]
MDAKAYKALSVKEFTKAAAVYETDHAGIYNMCKKDYPDILEELEREPFQDLLDCGCGTAPMISLLYEKYPEKHYTGIDLTPKMIETAKAKQLPDVTFIVGDCENLPFAENAFDAIICSQSFHHYPNPQDFFNSVYRVLRPCGRLILRDTTLNKAAMWFCNHVEMPLLNMSGHGDVRIYGKEEIRKLCDNAGLVLERFEKRKGIRMHCVVRKPQNAGLIR